MTLGTNRLWFKISVPSHKYLQYLNKDCLFRNKMHAHAARFHVLCDSQLTPNNLFCSRQRFENKSFKQKRMFQEICHVRRIQFRVLTLVSNI